MDLAMATMIVNKLNLQLNLSLPLNTCHTYIDLTKAIHKNLGLEGSSSAARSSAEPTRATRSER